jgi:hypothetical protein
MTPLLSCTAVLFTHVECPGGCGKVCTMAGLGGGDTVNHFSLTQVCRVHAAGRSARHK